MLTLITGTPGSGKTLWVVNQLSKVTDRTIYQDGVPIAPGLPWLPLDAHDWASVPDGSIVVVDEAQRVWGVRDPKKPVPPDVSAMETHRHRGIDIYVMTQHPKMLDHHLRRLVGRHIHLRRNAGLPSSLLLEADEVIEDPQEPGTHVQRSQFLFPREAFSLYKSAEIHTHKARISVKMIAMGALVLASLSAIGYAFYSVSTGGLMGRTPPPPAASALPQSVADDAARAGLPPPPPPAYVDGFVPETPLLPESAPVYAEKREVVTVPYLAGCISYLDPVTHIEKCWCYTQAGTRVDASYAECHAVIERPPFPYWAPRPSSSSSTSSRASDETPTQSQSSPGRE